MKETAVNLLQTEEEKEEGKEEEKEEEEDDEEESRDKISPLVSFPW